LGDLVGRRMIFWITTAVVIVFMAGKTFLAPFFPAYLIFKLIAASSYVATYQLPFSIITEITDASYRSWAIGITCVTW
jgi:MFS family permease